MSASLNLYDLTVPTFTRTLTNLKDILEKAKEHAKSQSTFESDLVEARIAPDMLPFPRQVQICCDTAKFLAVRVAGHEDVKMEDKESTLEEFQTRIQKTLDFLAGVNKDEFDGVEGKEITLMGKFTFTGQSYVTQYALPNFFFHVVTAYDILRMKGVQIGKFDYLGNM